MNRRLICMVCSAWLILEGCSVEPPVQTAPPPESPLTPVALAADSPPVKPTQMVVARVRVGVVEVPAGLASGSEEIWSYLEEEVIEAARSAGLDRNGLRAGVGKEGIWPDLERNIKQMTGREVSYATLTSFIGEPMAILLSTSDQERTIFIFHPDRTLSGSSYPPGDNLLAISCSINQDQPDVVHISVVPQIKAAQQKPEMVINPTGPALLSSRELISFDALNFRASVPVRGFMVVGPGSLARDPMSLGHHFLSVRRKGVTYERLIILIPELFTVPAG